MKQAVISLMRERNITVDEIADLVYNMQRKYNDRLIFGQCKDAVERVLDKREVQHSILTGLALDMVAEKGLLPNPLQEIITRDEPLYGIDEIMGMAICNIYGTIGVTGFGYLDKLKIGLVGVLDNDKSRVNTFADDLVAAIAAAAAAKLAHGTK